jgi:hypothetical protein
MNPQPRLILTRTSIFRHASYSGAGGEYVTKYK